MDYETKFDAKLAIWTQDKSLGRLSLPYPLVLEKYVGDARSTKSVWNENCFHYLIGGAIDGYVEEVIAEMCESLGKLKNEQIVALAANGGSWVVIGLLDSEFVEVHVSLETQKALTKFGLGLSIENRAGS